MDGACGQAESARVGGHGVDSHQQQAVQQAILGIADEWGLWNLVTAYELYTGTMLKVPHLVFALGQGGGGQEKILLRQAKFHSVGGGQMLRLKGLELRGVMGSSGCEGEVGHF